MKGKTVRHSAILFGLMIGCSILGTRFVLGDVSLGVDSRFQFVLTAEGELLQGVEIRSASGSIRPGTKNEAGPFQFALAQNESHSTWGTLGGATLEGEFKLPSRWNAAGVPDLQWQYGVGAAPSEAIPVFPELPPFAPDPNVRVSLDEDQQVVISGTGQELIGISFQSPSGSLVPGPAGDAGPFHQVFDNDSRQVSYGVFSNNQPVLLDGSVTLPLTWNPIGLADVEFHYNKPGPIHSGAISLPIEKPEIDRIGLSLNDRFQFVLDGTGQRVNRVEFDSIDGTLIPAGSPAPFDRVAVNSNGRIRYEADTPVVIDGQVELDAAWNRNLGYQDISFGYAQDGFDIPSIALPGAFYPITPVTDPVSATVDFQTRQLVISGMGQELRNVRFTSASGALVHDGRSVGPFDETNRSRSTGVTLESSEFVTVDGSVTLPIKASSAASQQDIVLRYDQVGVVERQGPFRVIYPLTLTPVRAAINKEGKVVIQGAGHQLEWIEFTSESGALIPHPDTGPFADFGSNTPERVRLQGDVTLDNFAVLSTAWDELAGADIRFTYKLKETDVILGPNAPRYPPANIVTIMASPAITDQFQLIGEGQRVTGIELMSSSGSLITFDDPQFGEFDIVEAYGPDHIRLLSTAGVEIDFLELPISWDPSKDSDILVTMTAAAGTRPVVPRIIYTVSLVPEPAAGFLAMGGAFVLIMIYRRARRGPRTTELRAG